MGARSKVQLLPKAVKEWLDKALVENNFSDYALLADHLKSQGHEISKSGVHRYGVEFERNLKAVKLATEQARAIGDAAEDEGNALSDSLLRLVQTKAFGSLVDMDMNLNMNKPSFGTIARIATDTGFASTTVKEFRSKVKDKAKAAATEVATIVKKAGLTKEAALEIQKQILGIAA